MQIQFNDTRPIFLQIANGIEDAILSGAYPEESQIPSTTEISVTYKINPATALKGINLLVDDGVLYKRRGLGMFVAQGALERVRKKRQDDFYTEYVLRLTQEAKRLALSLSDVAPLIERGFYESD